MNFSFLKERFADVAILSNWLCLWVFGAQNGRFAGERLADFLPVSGLKEVGVYTYWKIRVDFVISGTYYCLHNMITIEFMNLING